MATDNHSDYEETVGMDQRKLDSMLDMHRQWLESQEKDGVQADLSGKNLRGLSFRAADLKRAILQNADLSGADLSNAQLNEAVLRGAILKDSIIDGAKLRGAQVYDADLYGARLREVNLQNVEGLAECQLAGTDLLNCKLPPDMGNWGSLEQIEDISVQARTLLWISIGACVFGVVTMSVTSDAVILSHIGSTLLPVVQINVPIGVFSFAMPVVLLGLYLYLHFQLQYLWNGLASLPSFFPDGVSLDERAYPLFLRSLVRLHVPLLKKHRPPQWWLQPYASIAVAWGLVPFTIILFWIRYLRMHEAGTTLWHILLLASAFWFGLTTYGLAVDTLGGKKRPEQWMCVQSDSKSVQRPHTLRNAAIAAVLLLLCSLVSGAAFCIEGEPSSSFILRNLPLCEDLGCCFRQMLGLSPSSLECFGETQCAPKKTPAASDGGVVQQWIRHLLCADISFGAISHRPENWLLLRREERENLMGVKGALLTNVNLQGADGHGAFLADATLYRADLQGADFSGADLRKADLTQADMRRAKLRNVDLRGAHLDKCCLKHADLKRARLSRLSVPETPGSEKPPPETSSKLTSIFRADLECANLYKADLSEANCERSILSRANLQEAILGDANLKKANLQGAILRGVRLNNVDLDGATLQGADLSGADLSEAKGLTAEQIKKACGDEHTRLPSNIRIRLKRCTQCPKRYDAYDD
jgi:uncharacterized protein YjbI with pentapeptide repeats